MKSELKTFYRKLVNVKNPGTNFSFYDGKIYFVGNSLDELEKLNLPKGYTVSKGKIFKYGIEIGEFELRKNTPDIAIDDDDLDDLSNIKVKSSIGTKMRNVGYFLKNKFSRKPKNNSSKTNKTSDSSSNITVKKKKTSIKNFFAGIGYGLIRTKNFIGQKVASFFEYLGKRNDVKVDDDLINSNKKKSDATKAKNKEAFIKKFESIELELRAIEKLKKENPTLDFSKFKDRFNEIAKEFNVLFRKFTNDEEVKFIDLINLKSKASMLKKEVEDFVNDNKKTVSKKSNTPTNKNEEIKKLIDNYMDLSDKFDRKYLELENLIDSKGDTENKDKLEIIGNKEIELYWFTLNVPKDSRDASLTDEEIEEFFDKLPDDEKISRLNDSIIKENEYIKELDNIKALVNGAAKKSTGTKKTTGTKKVVNKPLTFKFTSIDDVKKEFEKYDKYESIEEKIKYYEKFLFEHNLSHPEDADMKVRMEQKLAELKAKYQDGKTVDNNNRTEQLAYYTQTVMGIDKAIEKIEKERQLKILKEELKGKKIVNLGLAEERKIDAKIAELKAIKLECLKRKAEINKYYEDQAAKMTMALKR